MGVTGVVEVMAVKGRKLAVRNRKSPERVEGRETY